MVNSTGLKAGKDPTMKFLLIFVVLITLIVTYRFTVLSSTPNKGDSIKTEVEHVELQPRAVASPAQSDVRELTTTSSEPANAAAESIGLVTDPALIAQIEQDMQFTPAPEGDLSYMSPEAETVQIDEPFPATQPDPNLKLGESELLNQEENEQISQPLDPNTKMSDL